MRKLFFSICSFLPGGCILLGIMLLFVGCSRYQYRTQADKFRVQGITLAPERVAIGLAEAEAIRAEAEATRTCARHPEKCRAMQLQRFAGWNYGGYATPIGGAWVSNSFALSSKKAQQVPEKSEKKEENDLEKENTKLKKRLKELRKALSR